MNMSIGTPSPARACRCCGSLLEHPFLDLGTSPPSQSHVGPDQLDAPEVFFPLRVFVCASCFLVQLPEHVAPRDIFTEYAYFSSYSDSWLKHARDYVERMIHQLELGERSRVVELASNDGYLLQYFLGHGIRVIGVEPAENVARSAIARGVPTTIGFFGRELAQRIRAAEGAADLIVANNVLAHVPDLNDFVAGIRMLLADDGVVTIEFPHLEQLLALVQFDTIYHEHFSYFSFTTARFVLARHGLRVFQVEHLSTHGGSLRVFACHESCGGHPVQPGVSALLEQESAAGLHSIARYTGFGDRVAAVKRQLLRFLIDCRDRNQKVAGYGAPGKGNTLLNYCGIRTDLLEFTVDRNPYKQGKFTPGTRIPILHPNAIRVARPDFLLILPWNLRDEIVESHGYVREWGGKFVVPIPKLEIIGT